MRDVGLNKIRFGKLFLWAIFPGVMIWSLLGSLVAIPYLIIAIPLAVAGHFFVGAIGERVGGVFHPRASGIKDDRAIVKGMYALAQGETGVSKFRAAEKIYLGIIKDYPSEIDAHVFLGKLYEEKLGEMTKAAKQYGKADKLIVQLKITDYKYGEFLKKRLADLSSRIAAPKNI